MMFSSLQSSRNLHSSRGLVKISANWSLVPICEVYNIPFDDMISQKMVPDVYVFGSRMLTRVVSNLDSTLIVT
jgi:hypothetical protein